MIFKISHMDLDGKYELDSEGFIWIFDQLDSYCTPRYICHLHLLAGRCSPLMYLRLVVQQFSNLFHPLFVNEFCCIHASKQLTDLQYPVLNWFVFGFWFCFMPMCALFCSLSALVTEVRRGSLYLLLFSKSCFFQYMLVQSGYSLCWAFFNITVHFPTWFGSLFPSSAVLVRWGLLVCLFICLCSVHTW